MNVSHLVSRYRVLVKRGEFRRNPNMREMKRKSKDEQWDIYGLRRLSITNQACIRDTDEGGDN